MPLPAMLLILTVKRVCRKRKCGWDNLCYAPRELICAELAKKDVLARERDIAEVGRAKLC